MNWNFILGHWILTLLCGPIILIVKNCVFDYSLHNVFGLLRSYPVMVIMGFMFSIPTYIFCNFIYMLIKKKNIKPIYEKVFFTLIIVMGIFTTTALIGGTMWFDLALSYSISSIIVIGLLFKLNFEKSENEL